MSIVSVDAFNAHPALASRFLSIDDLSHMPNPTWMVEGMFEANSLVMLAGPPASYKSFLALDWLLCLATGRRWNDRHTIPSKVLYVLGEGKASLLKRIEAWTYYHNLNGEEKARLSTNFKVTFDVPQMALKGSVDNMLAALSLINYAPNVICIDTFARSFVGLDENSQKDTGMWVESADRLRQLGYTVLFLHHTSKNTEFGLRYRGSTAIMGAMDTAMTLSKEADKLILKVSKQKDHDEGDPLYFVRRIVSPNPREEGSVILTPTIMIDQRFSEEGLKAEKVLTDLIEDASFASDRDRARELARQCGLTESAAQARVRRRREGK